MDKSELSLIDTTEEMLFMVGTFALCSIGLVIAILIWTVLYYRITHSDIINRNSAYFAFASVTFSIITYLSCILLCNDVIIPWDYKNKHLQFAIISESINICAYSFGKISFYFGFSYHVIHVYTDENGNKIRLFLKIWMTVFGLIAVVCCIAYIIDDAVEYSEKETGITTDGNIYITMYLSHEGALLSKMLMFVMMIVDSTYFCVLIFLYLKKLKKEKTFVDIAIKGVVLMVSASIVYWIFLIIMFIQSPLKWIFYPIDIITDDIALFLMFSFNKRLYHKVCFIVCHRCCAKIVYGKSYQQLMLSKQMQSESQNEITLNEL
eukprot:527945_1